MGRKKKEFLCTIGVTAIMGNSMAVPQKKKKLPYDSAIPLLSLYPQEKNHDLKEISVPYVHCSIIHNNQGMDTS